VRRNVTLKVSMDHRAPVVLGFFKPVILLPADAGLEGSEHILRHELAHVRRRDDWTTWFNIASKPCSFSTPPLGGFQNAFRSSARSPVMIKS